MKADRNLRSQGVTSVDIRDRLVQAIVRVCGECAGGASSDKMWRYGSYSRYSYSRSRSGAPPHFPTFSSNEMRSNDGVLRGASEYQAIANIMYGLSLMIFDVHLPNFSTSFDERSVSPQGSSQLAQAHVALLDTVSRLDLSRFSHEERNQILIYAHLLQTLPGLRPSSSRASPPQYLFAASSTGVTGNLLDFDTVAYTSQSMNVKTSSSKLQQSVISALSDALQKRCANELQVCDEYSAFGGIFPVDAMVVDGKTGLPVVFVEVDGPQHFKSLITSRSGGKFFVNEIDRTHARNSTLIGNEFALSRKDLMKEALYKCKHPQAAFTRVRYDQVNYLGSAYVGNEMANYITILRTHSPQHTNYQVSEINDLNGFILRHAERELREALEGKFTNNWYRSHHSRSYDFVYADVEEDNS